MFKKLLATIETWWTQKQCSHGPWVIDWTLTDDGKRTCHCQKCWKQAVEGSPTFKLARKETFEEWIHRALENGMTLQHAQDVWVEFRLFNEPVIDGEKPPVIEED